MWQKRLDTTERVYEYVCSFFEDWGQPALEIEIMQDLAITPRAVKAALAQLADEGCLRTGTTLPTYLRGSEPLQ